MTTPRRVLICLAPERSSYNAALIVARHLREHGHSVVIAGADVPELQSHAQRQGLEHLTVAPNPRVYAERFTRARTALARLELQRDYQRDAVDAWEAFARRRDQRFDLAVCDVIAMDPAAFALSELRIPTLALHTSYASRFSSQCPPVFSTAVAGEQDPSWSRRLAFLLAWSRIPIVRNVDVRRPASWLKAPPRLLVEQTFPFARIRTRTKHNGCQRGPAPRPSFDSSGAGVVRARPLIAVTNDTRPIAKPRLTASSFGACRPTRPYRRRHSGRPSCRLPP